MSHTVLGSCPPNHMSLCFSQNRVFTCLSLSTWGPETHPGWGHPMSSQAEGTPSLSPTPPPGQQVWSLGVGRPPQQGARAGLGQLPSRGPCGSPWSWRPQSQAGTPPFPQCTVPAVPSILPAKQVARPAEGPRASPWDLQVCHSGHRDLRPPRKLRGHLVLFAGRTQCAHVPAPSRSSLLLGPSESPMPVPPGGGVSPPPHRSLPVPRLIRT